MTWTLTEPIIDSLIAQLQANLPAKLDAIEAEGLTPAITLEDVTAFAHGERENFSAYPAIAITPTRTRATYEKAGKATFANRVTLIVYVSAGNDEDVLTRKLERYVRAIAEVLEERDQAGAFSFELLLEEEDWDYSPTLNVGGGGQTFMRLAFMPLVCWKAEEES